ncbi:hypothetical protein IVB33_11585 [Bradyrhizobium sp. 24]|nr:hypothetical protein [Bradyrhizobium sp. 24]
MQIVAAATSEAYRLSQFIPARLAVSSRDKSAMCKGILISLIALFFLLICDQFWSNGRYTDVAIVMAKHIGRSFGV